MRWHRSLFFGGCVFSASAALLGSAACKSTPTESPPSPDSAAVDVADASDALSCAPSTLTAPQRPLRILFFTKETLYFHVDAHNAGDVAVPAYLRARGHEVTVSNDPALFTDIGLSHLDVILFFVTSGSFLSPDQRQALVGFVHAGKGVAGVHTATATELDSEFFRDMMGASFAGHGVGDAQIIPAQVRVTDPASPLSSFLPNPWIRSDEWYYYAINPATNAALKPLLALDESSIAIYYPDYPEAGFYGYAGHPLSWTQDFQCGRVFYTALGHTAASYSEELFLRSIAVGTEWAGAPASASP